MGAMGRTVGVLTYHAAYNFGAVLQAFALQRTISGLGYDCSIVDYRAPDEASSYPLFRTPRDRSSLSADALLLINLRAHLRSRRRYESFRAEHLSLTPRTYRSADDLGANEAKFDAYVSGSDQIWHPALTDRPGGRVFFQDFVSSSRRIAYAPSFGVAEIADRYRDRIGRYIERFAFLSAREDSGCKIIEGLTGRSAEHVLDPTLLQSATTYDEVAAGSQCAKPYILVYPTERSDALRDLAVRVRSELKLPIIAVLPWSFAPWRFSFADRLVYDAGPSEFLAWVRGAACVCTNSFHGVCFSVIFRRPFIGVPHGSTATRQQSLLKRLGLAHRLVAQPASAATGLANIDYAQVEARLRDGIASSVQYLSRALA